MEDRLTEVLIVIVLLFMIIMPFLCIGLTISNIHKEKYIYQLENKINELKFEKEYLEYAFEDSLNQRY